MPSTNLRSQHANQLLVLVSLFAANVEAFDLVLMFQNLIERVQSRIDCLDGLKVDEGLRCQSDS